VDKDTKDYEKWLTDKNLKPTRRQKIIWLVIWKASRETLPKEVKQSWISKLFNIRG